MHKGGKFYINKLEITKEFIQHPIHRHLCFEVAPFLRNFYGALSALDISLLRFKNILSLNVCLGK